MSEPTRELLDAIGDAFNANDIDAVMQYFADDAVFDNAAGPDEYGTRITGKEAVRAAFAGLFDRVENVHWETLDTSLAGDKGVCEYRRTVRHKNGEVEEFLSVDILTFRDGLIVHKDTDFKNRTG